MIRQPVFCLPKNALRARQVFNLYRTFGTPLFTPLFSFRVGKRGFDSSVSWVAWGLGNLCLTSAIRIAGVCFHVTGASPQAKHLTPVVVGQQCTPHQNRTRGFHRVPCSYLAGRVYPGSSMLKRKGVDAFQNLSVCKLFLSINLPLLLFLFWLAAMRSRRRDNKPSSFPFAPALRLVHSGSLRTKTYLLLHCTCEFFSLKKSYKAEQQHDPHPAEREGEGEGEKQFP